MKAANGFLAALLLSCTTAHAGESPIQPRLRMAQAFGPDYQGYGGGYGGFGPITRMEVDSKASRRLLARMQSLGYMRWLLLVGDLTGLPAMARIHEEITARSGLPVRLWVEAPDVMAGYLPEDAEVQWSTPPGDDASVLAARSVPQAVQPARRAMPMRCCSCDSKSISSN